MQTDDWQEAARRMLLLPTEATEFARSIDRLHFFVIGVSMAGALVIGLISAVWIFKYRRSRHPKPTPTPSTSTVFEVSVAGFLLALFISWWVIGFRQYVAQAQVPSDSLSTYVSAKQWMWKFAYPSGQSTIGLLVVPRAKNIRLSMTSRDVIHSFYVPAFRVKQDVLPGRYTTLWFRADTVGVYDGFCAEFCGTEHSKMRVAVVVLEPQDYAQWLDGNTPPLVEMAKTRLQQDGIQADIQPLSVSSMDLAERGNRLASKYGCFSCHTINGEPHVGPTWLGLYNREVQLTTGTVLADEDYLTRSMMQPQADIVSGYANVMPTYQGTLQQPDVAAILQFIQSLRAGVTPERPELPPVLGKLNAHQGTDAGGNDHE